jgi:SAM-dependent methyltransferase
VSPPPAADRTYNAEFAAYYDLITSHKDYGAEVGTLVELIEEAAPSAARRVLDVGCGTGGHAALLAERGYDVTAIDTSPEMVRRTQAKAPAVTATCGEVANLDAGEFDFAYSLYNVVNCLESLDALLGFVGEVASRLVEGGAFLVEAWNPIAVIAAPPEKVVRTYESDASRVTRTASPRPDFLRQRLDLEYEILVEDGKSRANTFTVTHNLTLFTPLEIEFALRRAGFGDVRLLTALPELAEATAGDRMLAFLATRGRSPGIRGPAPR